MPRPPKKSRSVSKSSAGAPPATYPLAAAALASFIAVDTLSLRLLDSVRRVATTHSTVLILGESGTGKDLLASLLHYLGAHPQEPLVKIDCASLPHDLLESELFGFEKGAFTGATHAKQGRLELAGRGTLVLDEVASLSLAMQAKLLRLIEDRRFDRLGGTKPVQVHARIVALSNIDLSAAVAARLFREDLFFRLNVVPLQVPALRDRTSDIPAITTHLLNQLSVDHHIHKLRLTSDAAYALRSYSFPGNVRELRNILERAIVGATRGPEGEVAISVEDLPRNVREAAAAPSSKKTLEDLEREYIAEILDFTRGKKSKAAGILGITRKTLLEKRKKYGL